MTLLRDLRLKQCPQARASARSGSVLIIVAVVLVVLAVAVGGLAYYVSQQVSDPSSGGLTAIVERADFIHDVVESGEVESSENIEVRCEVKSRNGAGTTILDVVREGSFVRGPYTNDAGEEVPGEILVTLDSSGLELEKQQEDIILNNKIASRDQALNLLIAAISALKEYTGKEEFDATFLSELTDKLGNDSEEVLAAIQSAGQGETTKGTFHVEEQGFQSELFLAEENFRKAQQYFRYSESLAAQGYVTELQLKSDEFAVEKARKDRDAAQTKLDVLRIHTKKKTQKTLAGDIYNALAVYRAEKNSVQVQEERVTEITEQIRKCIVRAPQDGQVVYANERDRRGGTDFVVEPGVAVRERQVIIRLPNSDKMQIESKVSESKISLVREGMQATVNIDAFDDMTLQGVVTRVNQYPEPSSWFSSTVKEYEANIQILDPPAELKSGLTAKVRIHAQHISDALQVPIQTIHRHQGQYYCFVKTALGWKVQPVVLGASNEKKVVIEEGLSQGDRVAMNPASLLDDVDLPQDAPTVEVADPQALESKYSLQSGERAKPPAAEGPKASSPSDQATSQSPGGPRDSQAIVSAIFSRSDTNKDGKLAKDELPERFQAGFDETDTNNDNSIDRAEMAAAMAKRMRQRPATEGAGQ